MLVSLRKLEVLGVALIALCGGCARQPSVRQISASQLLSRLAAKSERVRTSRFVVTVSGAGEDTEGRFIAIYQGSGAFDFERGEASLDIRLEQPRRSTLKLVFDETGAYVSAPSEFAGQLPEGKKWVRFSTGSLQRATAVDFSFILRGDPAEDIRFLLPETRSIKDLGGEAVREATTRHYQLTVDFQRLASALREPTATAIGSSRGFYARLVKRLGGSKPLLADVWIDKVGQVLRETTTVRGSTPTQTGSTEVTLRQTYDYFGFGVELSIAPPPASKTVDVSELPKR